MQPRVIVGLLASLPGKKEKIATRRGSRLFKKKCYSRVDRSTTFLMLPARWAPYEERQINTGSRPVTSDNLEKTWGDDA
jgi:hypothetical protein